MALDAHVFQSVVCSMSPCQLVFVLFVQLGSPLLNGKASFYILRPTAPCPRFENPAPCRNDTRDPLELVTSNSPQQRATADGPTWPASNLEMQPKIDT